MNLTARILGSAAIVAIAASEAGAVCPAGSVVVSPGFAGAINAAIASAGVGGTVCLEPGVYGENVQINKTITLLGDGATPGEVVIDARNGGAGTNFCNDAAPQAIIVDATPNDGNLNAADKVNNVRIENLAVQHACRDAASDPDRTDDNIFVNGDGFQAVNVVSRAGQGSGLLINGDAAQVSGSSFLGHLGGAGISVTGSVGPNISDNAVRNCGNGILAGAGINAVVQNNSVRNVLAGITGSGNNSQFLGNTIQDAGSGIVATGDGSVIDGNSAEAILGPGFSLTGSNPRVSNNSVAGAIVGGFNVNCNAAPCDQGFVTGNTAFSIFTGGFAITAASNSFRVEDNQAADTLVGGFIINAGAFPATISGNNVGRAFTGYTITGQGSTISDNTARTSAGSGFIVSGASNTLTGNEARKNLRDGFNVGGTGNSLIDTRTVRNKGEGVDLETTATNTTITNLVSQNNRIDCAADAAGLVAPGSSGISCEDGSNFAVVSEINDGF